MRTENEDAACAESDRRTWLYNFSSRIVNQTTEIRTKLVVFRANGPSACLASTRRAKGVVAGICMPSDERFGSIEIARVYDLDPWCCNAPRHMREAKWRVVKIM